MNKRVKILLLVVLLAGLGGAGLVLAAGSAAVGWQVISSGGAPAAGGSVTLNDTLGQPVIGASLSGSVGLQAGYWSGLGYDEQKCGLVEGATYAYNQAWPVSVTVQARGTLECLRVLRVDQDHPNRTGTGSDSGVGWGRYWTISATDAGGGPATGVTITLSLPHNGLTDPQLCKWPGGKGGSGWDCARDGFNGSMTWRSGIGTFSDWAVGNKVSPTVVEQVVFAARALPARRAWLVGLLGALALGAAGLYWRRRR